MMETYFWCQSRYLVDFLFSRCKTVHPSKIWNIHWFRTTRASQNRTDAMLVIMMMTLTKMMVWNDDDDGRCVYLVAGERAPCSSSAPGAPRNSHSKKKISAKLFVCKARQLLPTSDTSKSIQGPTNLVDQVRAIFQSGWAFDWQNTHHTKCTWLVDEVRYVMIWRTRKRKRNYFQLCCLGSWLVAKKSSQWLRCLVWSGSSVNAHPSKYYGLTVWAEHNHCYR